MRGFLLDTNCISEVVRLHPEPRVMAWIEASSVEAIQNANIFIVGIVNALDLLIERMSCKAALRR
jgi:predicted nucleic acid-binding protein